ncbi:hypothetical protein GCM10010124_26070 [Pilimelia terevasa]|uniref:Prohead serine protease domain-containing protein n=1 Tax=Pilimelia terevasa TaxID=53372 RepID=A0A8J3FJ38_9ACTN|nr:HK97 family phage prohead protease [Pilimelia terevasa]GGK32107.1 hypothetical protein GCM10010124_26070 [Pilimelia terevasa]
MDTKHLRVEVKDADRGEFAAIFSTFDVVDHDRDVTKVGAFTDGAPVRVSAYGHAIWGGALPVGKGVIRTTGREAIAEGAFFLDTAAGRDTFTVVKELGDLQEWSYGYDATKFSFGEVDGKQVRFLEELKVHEVSPVLLGAGVGTRTLSAKSGGSTFSDEAQAVVAALDALVVRAADVMAKRREKGKGLGADSAALLGQVDGQLKALAGLLAEPDPEPDHGDVQREFLRFVAISRDLNKEMTP